jgi:hypothetical protein
VRSLRISGATLYFGRSSPIGRLITGLPWNNSFPNETVHTHAMCSTVPYTTPWVAPRATAARAVPSACDWPFSKCSGNGESLITCDSMSPVLHTTNLDVKPGQTGHAEYKHQQECLTPHPNRHVSLPKAPAWSREAMPHKGLASKKSFYSVSTTPHSALCRCAQVNKALSAPWVPI